MSVERVCEKRKARADRLIPPKPRTARQRNESHAAVETPLISNEAVTSCWLRSKDDADPLTSLRLQIGGLLPRQGIEVTRFGEVCSRRKPPAF